MFQCRFDNDSGEYALAKRQAEAYPGTDVESKVKGNLAEIAFQGLCRQILPLNKWHWHNGSAIRRAESEYNNHDFTVLGRTIDVKARSDVNQLFNIKKSEINSDIVVLSWVPPEITEEVIDAEDVSSLSRVHPREHDPVTVLGWIEKDKLNPPKTTLSNPARGNELTFRHFEIRNIADSPLGSNLTEWLSEEENTVYSEQGVGITTDHIDKNGKRISPGNLVKRPDGDSYIKSLAVECPFEPPNCEFDNENRQYGPDTYDPTDPAVGVVAIADISDDVFERVHKLSWDNLQPAITAEVAETADIEMLPASSLEVYKDITRLSHPVEKPTDEEW